MLWNHWLGSTCDHKALKNKTNSCTFNPPCPCLAAKNTRGTLCAKLLVWNWKVSSDLLREMMRRGNSFSWHQQFAIQWLWATIFFCSLLICEISVFKVRSHGALSNSAERSLSWCPVVFMLFYTTCGWLSESEPESLGLQVSWFWESSGISSPCSTLCTLHLTT